MRLLKISALSISLSFFALPQGVFAQDTNCGQNLDTLLGTLLEMHPKPTAGNKGKIQVKNPKCLREGLQHLKSPDSAISQKAGTYGGDFKILVMNLIHWFLDPHQITDAYKTLPLTGVHHSALKGLHLSPEEIHQALENAWEKGKAMRSVKARQEMWKKMERSFVEEEKENINPKANPHSVPRPRNADEAQTPPPPPPPPPAPPPPPIFGTHSGSKFIPAAKAPVPAPRPVPRPRNIEAQIPPPPPPPPVFGTHSGSKLTPAAKAPVPKPRPVPRPRNIEAQTPPPPPPVLVPEEDLL